MTNTLKTHKEILIKNKPQFLWFITLAFSMTIAISNWYDARIIELFGFAVSPGALIFPVTLLLSDIITEVYGYKQARRAIWAAFIFNFIFILYGQLVAILPSPAFATDNEAFNKLIQMNGRIIAASLISYLISEPLNSYLMSRAKMISKGEYIGFRFVLSTVVSSFFDSLLFIPIAFYGIFPNEQLLHMIFNIWVIKISIEIGLLPFSIRATTWLKEKEELDIYDFGTNFSPFSLDAEYKSENNLYNSSNKDTKHE